MKDYSAACDGRYKAVHDSGPRHASDIGWIVIHSTEGDTAEGAASWFANPASGGSANLCIDDAHCFRTVADLRTPWAAPPLNQRGFHIEIAGYAGWSRYDWLAHPDRLERAAFKAAQRSRIYQIPVRQVGAIGLRLGRKGFVTHNAVSKAWRQSDHHDPGPGFPLDRFLQYVRYFNAKDAL